MYKDIIRQIVLDSHKVFFDLTSTEEEKFAALLKIGDAITLMETDCANSGAVRKFFASGHSTIDGGQKIEWPFAVKEDSNE